MIFNQTKAVKNGLLGLTLVVGVGVVGCGESDNLPKANQENCNKLRGLMISNDRNAEIYKELGLVDAVEQDKDIYNAKCQIFEAEEVKRTGETPFGKATGKDKEELDKEMDKEIAMAKEKIKKLQAEKKAAK